MKNCSLNILVGLILVSIAACSNATSQKQSVSIAENPQTLDGYVYKGLSEDALKLYLKHAATVSANKKSHLPFNKLRYDKVILYNYEGGKGGTVYGIVENGKLSSRIREQRGLDQTQADLLTALLSTNSTYGESPAFCFEPHLGVVFFYENTIVADIEICLDCNHLRSSVKIPASEAKRIEISKGHTYAAEGFSKLGKEKIEAICRQLSLNPYTVN